MKGLFRLAALPLLLFHFAMPAHADWREASSRHFTVYSEGGEQALREFATKLEKFDKAMRLRIGLSDLDFGPANRVTVFLVDDRLAVQRLLSSGDRNVAGFYSGRADGSIAVVPRSSDVRTLNDLDPATILLHEYSHHIMMQNSRVAYPAWFREGFAEFNSTARFEKDGSIGFGAAANHRARGLIYMAPLPIELLFDPNRRKLSQAEWEATIYGRGWLLTHFLMFEPSRVGQLDAYIEALNSGRDSVTAAQAAFGDLKILDRQLKDYLDRRMIPYKRYPAADLTFQPIAVRTLRPGEAAIMELRMRARIGVRGEEEEARLARDLRKAAAPWPNDPSVQAALAEAEFDAGNLDSAQAAADRALAADPKNADALTYRARVAMERAKAGPRGDSAAWKEVRRRIALANRADPNDPEPLILFYQSFAAQGVAPTRNAVEGLIQAFELAPQDRGLRLSVGRQLLVDGKAAEARAALVPIAFDPHGGALGQAIVAIVATIDRDGARAALDAWDRVVGTEQRKGETKKPI
ncbi:MAG TPA: tetratricopeptide repeat protein [Allosphingosinicella sp.]|jgi:tetratricopeptide (TPR) repeat protein